MMKIEKIIILTILLFSFILLFYATSTILLNGCDEEEHFLMASRISFKPDNLNLPLAFKDIESGHGPLSAYLIKLGFLLFQKENIISGRFIFVLLGTLGILLVYSLVKKGINNKVAIFSIILLSVEKYYICHMRYGSEEPICIFFSLLAIYVFFKALNDNNKLLMVLVGLIIGIGFYGKETPLLLFPIFLLYLLWDKKYRFWLGVKETYIAMFIFCAVAIPFVVYNLQNDFFTFRHVTSMARFTLFSPVSLTVLFGEPLSFLVDKSIIIRMFDCEYPFMNWLGGILILSGVIYSALHNRNNSLIKLLLVVFSFNFILFSVVGVDPKKEPLSFFNNHFWASMMVVPGVILAANMLSALWDKHRIAKIFIVLFISYLAFDLIEVINLPEPFYIPRKDLMIETLINSAHRDLDRRCFAYAKKRFEKVLIWDKKDKDLEEARRCLIYISKIEKSLPTNKCHDPICP